MIYCTQSPADTDGGLLHPAGGDLPIPCGKKEVMDMFKTALELALLLLKLLHEFFGLIKDMKHPRRHDQ